MSIVKGWCVGKGLKIGGYPAIEDKNGAGLVLVVLHEVLCQGHHHRGLLL